MSPPPLPEKPQDAEQIRLLVVFHYVMAGLSLAGLGFLLLHFYLMSSVFGMMKTVGEVQEETQQQQERSPSWIEGEGREDELVPDPEELEVKDKTREMSPEEIAAMEKAFGAFSKIMVVFYVIMAIFAVLGAVLNFLSARAMTRRENKTLSMVTAGVNCLGFPLGTALGVFTFVVLGRPSVSVIYDKQTR